MHGKLKVIFQLIYSVVMFPVLYLTMKLAPGLHMFFVRPLVSGPFKGALTKKIWSEIYRLEGGKIDDEEFISNVSNHMVTAYKSGELNSFLFLADEKKSNLDVTLLRCLNFLPMKWWYLKMHFMAPGNRHHVHAHRTVISAQAILRGELVANQYNLLAKIGEDVVKLQPVPITKNRGCQVLISTDKYCNVHGFEPLLQGALRLQFYLRGHDTFLGRIPKRGRLYVHFNGQSDQNGSVFARIGETGRSGES